MNGPFVPFAKGWGSSGGDTEEQRCDLGITTRSQSFGRINVPDAAVSHVADGNTNDIGL
jgi:hypothetical protein